MQRADGRQAPLCKGGHEPTGRDDPSRAARSLRTGGRNCILPGVAEARHGARRRRVLPIHGVHGKPCESGCSEPKRIHAAYPSHREGERRAGLGGWGGGGNKPERERGMGEGVLAGRIAFRKWFGVVQKLQSGAAAAARLARSWKQCNNSFFKKWSHSSACPRMLKYFDAAAAV
jgi:hypothetical protein